MPESSHTSQIDMTVELFQIYSVSEVGLFLNQIPKMELTYYMKC